MLKVSDLRSSNLPRLVEKEPIHEAAACLRDSLSLSFDKVKGAMDGFGLKMFQLQSNHQPFPAVRGKSEPVGTVFGISKRYGLSWRNFIFKKKSKSSTIRYKMMIMRMIESLLQTLLMQKVMQNATRKHIQMLRYHYY